MDQRPSLPALARMSSMALPEAAGMNCSLIRHSKGITSDVILLPHSLDPPTCRSWLVIKAWMHDSASSVELDFDTDFRLAAPRTSIQFKMLSSLLTLIMFSRQ